MALTLHVPDISCGHCAQTITRALTPLEGVLDVEVDIVSKQVHVWHTNGMDRDRIYAALDQVGYAAGLASPELGGSGAASGCGSCAAR